MNLFAPIESSAWRMQTNHLNFSTYNFFFLLLLMDMDTKYHRIESNTVCLSDDKTRFYRWNYLTMRNMFGFFSKISIRFYPYRRPRHGNNITTGKFSANTFLWLLSDQIVVGIGPYTWNDNIRNSHLNVKQYVDEHRVKWLFLFFLFFA